VARAAVGAAFVALVVHTLAYAAYLEDPLTWTLLALGAALCVRAREPALA
jgi:putative inorganic carbon (hco3(-)) transporter